MPHYRFHLFNHIVAMDEEGTDLTDLPAAREHAIANIRSVMTEEVLTGRLVLGHRIEVEEEGVGVVLTVPFREAIQIED